MIGFRKPFEAESGGMIGRVYRWRGGLWKVLVRWQGSGPRNVLIENVETGERIVRPFRGLRRP
jgi:hypothetical protein